MFGFLVAAIMAASFFMPWMSIFGEDMSPYSMLGDKISFSDLPWRGWAFIASFALAGLAAVAVLLQRAGGLLMLVAGAIPFALIAEAVLNARGQAQDLGLPLPEGGNPIEAIRKMQDFIEMGLPAYFVSAALLIVIGLARAVRGR